MIAVCDYCKQEYKTLPSWYNRSPNHYCSRQCSAEANRITNANHLRKVGISYRFKPGHKPSPNRKMPKGEESYNWKGDKVGYRGLHYWLRRVKGIPPECQSCKNPKGQWANIDGLYRRDPDDFVSLCASCHKLYDLSLATQGGVHSTQ